MTNTLDIFENLRQHRSILLACEAIGWLHMTGKANIKFLHEHGGQKTGYKYEEWDLTKTQNCGLNNRLKWVKNKFASTDIEWPDDFREFIEDHKNNNSGLLGLLQAGHAMASGIEKNLPKNTSEYLGQDITHMWLSTAFGHPVRNLVVDPPELLNGDGWKRLIEQVRNLLSELKKLGSNASENEIDDWWSWREDAVGSDGWLRKAFSSTLAETRLPNNDVTLFDQSYVAAALFKSATAGAILEGKSFPWTNNQLKQLTRWRLLTVGIGVDHYEARSVKIGDWTGARMALDDFFNEVCKLVEINLAVGSLLYRDSGTCVFSFPGEQFCDKGKGDQGSNNLQIDEWKKRLTEKIEAYAKKKNLEMPPYCRISEPSRSLVGMTKEIRNARETVAVPLHREWPIEQKTADGHVCPVCFVRTSLSKTNKQTPCKTCQERRTHRLEEWLSGKFNPDTIWIDEVADANDRVALVTMSLDIEPWLDGTRLDAFRTQAISEWRNYPSLKNKNKPNPIDPGACFVSLSQYIKGKLHSFDKNDPVLTNLQAGYRYEKCWKSFFYKIVEDRANAPSWDKLSEDKRAAWLTHQLFCKLASPGRIYRFERQAEDFFKTLLDNFRIKASLCRTGRLIITPNEKDSDQWKDQEIYSGRYGDAPVSLLYCKKDNHFITICNQDRLLKTAKGLSKLKGKTLELKTDDSQKTKQLVIESIVAANCSLGAYHPVIPLELSPVRFRALLPLEAVSACVDEAIETWNDQFARVWDSLPLRIGVVACTRVTPFQAVIEAARNLESTLMAQTETLETWEVTKTVKQGKVITLSLKLQNEQQEHLQTIPFKLPSGRLDVFYPYLRVDDTEIRDPLDFQHPDGHVYRHVENLICGDKIEVYPSCVATIFLDSTARRFEKTPLKSLDDWQLMRDIWKLINHHAPDRSALRGAWSEIVERRELWLNPDESWSKDTRSVWLDFVRTVIINRLKIQGNNLETLVNNAANRLLEWSLEWHMSILKQQSAGGDQ